MTTTEQTEPTAEFIAAAARYGVTPDHPRVDRTKRPQRFINQWGRDIKVGQWFKHGDKVEQITSISDGPRGSIRLGYCLDQFHIEVRSSHLIQQGVWLDPITGVWRP